MDKKTLETAAKLSREIEELGHDIKILSLACSDRFNERPISVNIYNTSQDEGYATVPKSIMKTVCKIALLECNELKRTLEMQLDNL